jgi:hypothetical protein
MGRRGGLVVAGFDARGVRNDGGGWQYGGMPKEELPRTCVRASTTSSGWTSRGRRSRTDHTPSVADDRGAVRAVPRVDGVRRDGARGGAAAGLWGGAVRAGAGGWEKGIGWGIGLLKRRSGRGPGVSARMRSDTCPRSRGLPRDDLVSCAGLLVRERFCSFEERLHPDPLPCVHGRGRMGWNAVASGETHVR